MKIICTKFQRDFICKVLEDQAFCPCITLGIDDKKPEDVCRQPCCECLKNLIDFTIEE